jgi:hypothetical protein
LSVRLVMQAALEAEISEFLGRDRYARGERERAGYRNGHAELTVKTTAGPVVLERPKLRGTAQPFADRYGKRYPAAVACLLDSLPELTTFLRFPREHWQRIRHTNLIERTFGETRRRIKVIGRLPGERSCLSLVWAVLDRAARGWRGVVMTPAAVRLLQELRRQLHHPARLQEVVDRPVTPAAYHAPSGARVRRFPPEAGRHPGEDAQPEAAEKIHASTGGRGTQTVCAGRGQPADDGRGRWLFDSSW